MWKAGWYQNQPPRPALRRFRIYVASETGRHRQVAGGRNEHNKSALVGKVICINLRSKSPIGDECDTGLDLSLNGAYGGERRAGRGTHNDEAREVATLKVETMMINTAFTAKRMSGSSAWQWRGRLELNQNMSHRIVPESSKCK